MECRPGCAACCIAISISAYIPGMNGPKPAGVRCIQLTPDNLCKLYGHKERPKVCQDFLPSREFCGNTNEEAIYLLRELELSTS